MLVRDIATKDPKTVTTEFSLRNVLDILRNNDFRHVPVVDGRRNVKGILSETDLVSAASIARFFGEDREAYETFLQTPVAEILKTRFQDEEGLITVGPDDSLEETAARMLDNKLSALPVVEADGTLFGIVSYVDVLDEFLHGAISVEEDPD